MSESTNSQIKKPLETQEKQSQSVENGVSNAIKKQLPKIVNATGKVITAPVMAVGKTIKSGIDSVQSTTVAGLQKVKDFGWDLVTDVKDVAKDVLSPGGLITTMTGSPLLGAFVGEKLESAFDSTKDAFGNLIDSFKTQDEEDDDRDYYEENEPIIEALEDSDDYIGDKLDGVITNTDVTNDLLFNLLETNESFNQLYKDGQVRLLKDQRERQLREAEAERERLDALSKEGKEKRTGEKVDKGKKGFLESLLGFSKDSIIGLFTAISKPFKFFASMLSNVGSVLGSIGKFAGKAFVWLGIFNAAIESIKTLLNGGNLGDMISTFVVEFIRGFLVLPTMLIDYLAGLFGYDINLTDMMNQFLDKSKTWLSDFLDSVWDGLKTFVVGIGDFVGVFINTIKKDIDNIKTTILNAGNYIIEWVSGAFGKIFEAFSNTDLNIGERVLKFFEGIGELVFKPVVDFWSWIGQLTASAIGKGMDWIKSKVPSWLKWWDDEEIKVEKIPNSAKSILESSKKISELQRPIQTTIINNNTNNMTQMSNNNAIGRTNMIIGSSVRNNDPTFNQCLMSNMVPNI